MSKICNMDNCQGKIRARGWCRSHYYNWEVTGSPLHGLQGKTSARDRFFQKFKVNNESGCWEWTASLDKKGYGQLSQDTTGDTVGVRVGKRKPLKAHRLSYEIHKGSIADGLSILHACDNPACVNPDHLSLGTHTDNMQQMLGKGRHCHGENSHHAKLDASAVLRIHADPRKQAVIAQEYGIGQQSVSRIKKENTWKHLFNK